MSSWAEGTTPGAVGGLDERVLATLQGLQGRIAFSGLRRVLHAHPESLSRSLRRLEREGLVDRSPGGYRALVTAPRKPGPETAELRAIAQVDLPPGVPSDSVLGRLSGRWFGALRWVGVVDGPTGRLLAWARRDGVGYVLLGVERGVLRVFVREAPGADPADDEDSAYELLVHAVDALRPMGRTSVGSVSFFSYADPVDSPMFDN